MTARNSRKNLLLLLYYWLCLGFCLGTLTLMGPVRWAVTWVRTAGGGETLEKIAVLSLIGLLAAASFLSARYAASLTAAARKKRLKIIYLGGALCMCAVSLGFWMNPRLMTDLRAVGRPEYFSKAEFVFGPYPDRERMLELKADKYTAVISLLSPAVVPFEPVLIEQEAALAREHGVDLIHIPMLPWVSANDEGERKIKELAAKAYGRYYVHCYLGKDRVNIFRKMLGAASKDITLQPAAPGGMRTLYDIKKFERGDITLLERDVFFTPLPTDEEFFGYVLNGSVKTLVSLLNPANSEDLPWIEKEKALAAKYGLGFVNCPWLALDREEKDAAVNNILSLEKPLAIHAFNTTAPECGEFAQTYKRLKPR
jgi:hypothetical protein